MTITKQIPSDAECRAHYGDVNWWQRRVDEDRARREKEALAALRSGRADLRGADLSETNLEGARFDGADLRGANLRGARVSVSSLLYAEVDDTTVLPHGVREAMRDLVAARDAAAEARMRAISDEIALGIVEEARETGRVCT